MSLSGGEVKRGPRLGPSAAETFEGAALFPGIAEGGHFVAFMSTVTVFAS